MTKLEQAARQALEALENERSHMTANWDNIVNAITALRKALASRCQTTTTEQAEQSQLADASLEPVAWNDLDEDELAHKLGWRIGDPLYMTIVGIGQEAIHHFKAQNTAPVRTKDLTDDEIISALGADMDTDEDKECFIEIVRLGIAADREKNK